MTSNAVGDLAAHTFAELGLVTQGDLSNFATQGDVNALNSRLNALSGRTDKALSGVAMAFAMKACRSSRKARGSRLWAIGARSKARTVLP